MLNSNPLSLILLSQFNEVRCDLWFDYSVQHECRFDHQSDIHLCFICDFLEYATVWARSSLCVLSSPFLALRDRSEEVWVESLNSWKISKELTPLLKSLSLWFLKSFGISTACIQRICSEAFTRRRKSRGWDSPWGDRWTRVLLQFGVDTILIPPNVC